MQNLTSSIRSALPVQLLPSDCWSTRVRAAKQRGVSSTKLLRELYCMQHNYFPLLPMLLVDFSFKQAFSASA